jgi:hypothetical protein
MKTSDTTSQTSIFQQARSWYRALPDKKRYLEFITALLSIPVLVTIIIANVTNLRRNSSSSGGSTTPTPIIIRELVASDSSQQATSSGQNTSPGPETTQGAQCTPGIGPVEIVAPEENQLVRTNPVCIDVVRDSQQYCSVVWSYRMNFGPWSDYTNKSICIYDMPPGDKLLELRVQSIVSDDEVVLKRKFTVEASTTPSPTDASGSASL